MTINSASPDGDFVKNSVEAVIKIAFLALIVVWCFQIVRPFITLVVWGIVLAVALYPIVGWLSNKLGGKEKMATVILTLSILALILIPSYFLSASMIEGAQYISEGLQEGSLKVPPPTESVATWPLVGEQLYEYWKLASTNLEAAIAKAGPQMKGVINWLLGAAAGTGAGIVQFIISVIIAGVLMVNAKGGFNFTKAFTMRLAGQHGADFAVIAAATVRSVAQGVLGVAMIQALLAGIGLLVMGVPLAGLWAFLVLFLAVIQLPPILVLLPIIFYVFSVADTTPAVLFTIWSIVVSMSDAFLKPMFLGRGVDVPMLIILIGAIGGMMLSGIIGLFVGAVVLALFYKLFIVWLYPENLSEMLEEAESLGEEVGAEKA
ncbi:AI-2E family transporter [Kaarinaea lacus]